MNFLNFNLKKLVLTLALLLLPLISINLQQNPLATGWYDKPFSMLGSYLQVAFFEFSDGVRGTTALYLNLIDIKKNNQILESKNRELQTRLEQMRELEIENERLRGLQGFQANSKMEMISAQVMSKDLLADHNTLQISKGSQHGIKVGQAVIATGGVVGHVFRTENLTSQVLLLTDRYSVVDGIVARSRSRGIVEGRGGSGLSLKYVEKSEDVVAGDIVVTSGLDNIFPKGFPVARVKDVENKSYSVSLKVDLEPFIDPDKVEEVFVILNANNQDLSTQISMQE
ncbi:MAG: rod shape-determining protein MreC [Pseudobdellovibrionaceae bacterium]